MSSVVQRAARLHAQGVAATANKRPLLGARRLRAALRQLDAGGSDSRDRLVTEQLRGRILISLAYAEAEQGHLSHGWQLLAQAEPLLPPNQRGILYGQRGLLLRRTGKDDLALPQLDAAIHLLRGQSQPEDLARALLNRSGLHLNAARTRLARADLHDCIDVASRHGFTRIIPMAVHNLAFLDYLAGDLPAALRVYSGLAREYSIVKPGLLPLLALDRARALLAAGLFGEADRELEYALENFRRQRLGQELAEAWLTRAEAALLADRAAVARRWAARARDGFLRRDNVRWAAIASLLMLRAVHAAATTSPATTSSRAASLAATLRGLSLTEDAKVAELLAVRALLAAGQDRAAARGLSGIRAPRRSDRLDTRLLWRLANAEVAAATGHRTKASRHLSSGLVELQRYRSQLGCLDLQTGAAIHGRDLAGTGLRAAIAAGSPAQVYRWSERARAQALLLPPVRPPEDPDAAAALEELRRVRSALREAELAGRPVRGLRGRSDVLRRTIREHAWSAVGRGTTIGEASFQSVKAELADIAMVAYLRDGAALHALVIVGGTGSLVRLGSHVDAEQALLRLRADLDAQAGRALPRRLADAVAVATRRDAEAVTAAILGPLLDLVGDRDLVVVPTGLLVTVPWAALPACAQRPVTVAPSASTWIAARHRLRERTAVDDLPVLLVAGPGNARGDAEVAAIAGVRPHASVLTGADATPTATLAGLASANVAHLAAHGHHESDNALFSTLELAGGPLMGYDLPHLGASPAVVVLSSCDLGLSDVRPGDETIGMTTALLSAGSCTVVASVSRVADDVAMAIMIAFHRALARGHTAATALAAASPPEVPAGFVCFGAG